MNYPPLCASMQMRRDEVDCNNRAAMERLRRLGFRVGALKSPKNTPWWTCPDAGDRVHWRVTSDSRLAGPTHRVGGWIESLNSTTRGGMIMFQRRSRLARVVGIILVAVPALALTEPTGKSHQPGDAPRRTLDAQVSTAKQGHSRKIIRPANLRAVDRRLAQPHSLVPGALLPKRLVRNRARNDATQAATHLSTRRIPLDGLSVMPPVVVDYRDDLPSRLRRAGKLIGPVPLGSFATEGGIAAGAPCGGNNCTQCCTYPIECDDNDPCTTDNCTYVSGQPPGSGDCTNTTIADGLRGGCDNGEYCDGQEVCMGGMCQDGVAPSCTGQVCDDFQDACVDACTPGSCDDDKHCNGVETCGQDGVCQPGTNPCGADAACTEKVCTDSSGRPCALDWDCPEVGGSPGLCNLDGPGCFTGRCCLGDDFQTCSNEFRRTKEQGPNQVQTDQCLENGGLFYPTDEGRVSAAFGNTCFSESHRCPQISGGIAPQGPFLQVIGPISDSCALRVPAGAPTQPLNAVIDDYDFGPGSDPFYELHAIRWVGGAARLFIEFFDADGNFIDDTLPLVIFNSTIAVHPFIFSPPLLIPSKGFIRFRNASRYSPGGQVFLVTTDTFDVGINDAAVLCLNDEVLNASSGVIPSCRDPGASSAAASTGRLAFEMVGQPADPPTGACCNRETGTCTADTLTWVCASGTCSNDAGQKCSRSEECGDGNTCITGVYLGDGTLCGLCGADSGASEGAPCDEIGGADADDCNGGACMSRCDTGACCKPDSGDCLPDRTKDACSQLAPSEFLGFGTDCDPNCCDQPAVTGADNCQEAIHHGVNVPTQNLCVGGTNDGQPCPGGLIDCPDGINCAMRKVITITGDNSGASSTGANPDSCFGFNNNSVGSDPGWWEAFDLTDCAFVRIDFCCTDPIHEPAYISIYGACDPCGPAIFASPNPSAFDETDERAGRGEPYCDDGNLWAWFGPLPAGTYYYPIFSGVAGHLGKYQLHITVDACPKAACCEIGGDTCIGGTEGRSLLDCEAEGGVFLGPPNRFPLVSPVECANAVCEEGLCCAPEIGSITGPGSCRDNIAAAKMTLSQCDGIVGNYIGGIRCKGGTCSTSVNTSCDKNEDCPTGETCVGDVLVLAQPTPCPICEIEGGNNCQKLTTIFVQFSISELTFGGLTVADDFVPGGDTLTTICTSGLYINTFDADVSPETGCRQRRFEQMPDPLDKMRIRIYEDNNGLPGALFVDGNGRVGERFASKTRDLWGVANEGKVARLENPFGPNSLGFGIDDLTDEEYQIDISDDPITGLVLDGRTYWIEIINNMDQHEECIWLINHADSADGNSYAVPGAGGVFTDAAPFDLTFCLNFDFTAPDPPTGACCACVANDCADDRTLEECNGDASTWFKNQLCVDLIASGQCGAPVNDSCDGMLMIGPGLDIDGDPTAGSAVTWRTDHFCATTSLPNVPVCTDFSGTCATKCGGATGDVVGQDLWYGYVALEDGAGFISMCQTGTVWDSLFAIYRGPEGADPGDGSTCPCPTDVASCEAAGYEEGGGSLEIASDEGCFKEAVGGPGFLDRAFKADTCYVFQIGAWGPTSSTPGIGFVSLLHQTSCSCPVMGDADDGLGGDYNRVGDFKLSTLGAVERDVAIRVTLNRMYIDQDEDAATGCPVRKGLPDLQAFEGRHRYLGPPGVFNNNAWADPKWVGAKLQCTPLVRDWSPRALAADLGISEAEADTIYYYGAEVVPCSIHAVQLATQACVDSANPDDCFSDSLEVRTAKWGDVWPEFGTVNFTDIGKEVEAFKSIPFDVQGPSGAPNRWRSMLRGNEGTPDGNISFSDIGKTVDGFKAIPYREAGPTACP
ncbi:MAG: hypothetical protein IIC01_07115 [Planctomycetes bacterium]|nr:hypothetical protein [Planctomycetota bacterium]